MSKGNKIIPLGDRIIVRPVENEKKTAMGIIIPDSSTKEKPGTGIVVAVGEGRLSEEGKRVPVSVKVGDTVVFSKYSPDEIKVDGEDLYVLREESVLAIIK